MRNVDLFITLNGPIGSGKSWLASQLKKYYGIQLEVISSTAVPYEALLQQYPLEIYDYETFKVMTHPNPLSGGFSSGREILIQYINKMRESSPTWIADGMLDTAESISADCKIIVFDNVGRIEEFERIMQRVVRDSIMLNHIQLKHDGYFHGDTFNADSRQAVTSAFYGVHCEDSGAALIHCKEYIKDWLFPGPIITIESLEQ